MNFSSGDLIKITSDNDLKNSLGVIVKTIQTSVFAGGEPAQIITVLLSDASQQEVMSWDVKRVNLK